MAHLTAAPSFHHIVSDQPLVSLRIFSPEKIIKISLYRTNEMDENIPDRNIFVPDAWNDMWDRLFDDWTEQNFPLLTPLEETLPGAPKEVQRMYCTYARKRFLREVLGISGDDECKIESKLHPEFLETSTVETFESDIALIKVSNIPTKSRICFKNSLYIDIPTYSQHIYGAGYGFKGLIWGKGTGFSDLTWLSYLYVDEIERRNMNLTIKPRTIGKSYNNIQSFHILNTDFTKDGQLITSSSCPADSGSSIFVYASNHIASYAIQIGVMSGSYVFVSIFN